jgi:hypothetical protein
MLPREQALHDLGYEDVRAEFTAGFRAFSGSLELVPGALELIS